MFNSSLRFANIIVVALITGVQFGIWVGFDPRSFSAVAYMEHQQAAINNLNTLMPVLGLIAIILTLISAFRQREDKGTFLFLLCAVALLIISGLITKFGNQPINSVVMTWKPESIPQDWRALRDQWWSLHIIRTLSSLSAMFVIVWAGMKKS